MPTFGTIFYYNDTFLRTIWLKQNGVRVKWIIMKVRKIRLKIH